MKTVSINQGKLKTSSDIQKLKGFITSKSVPQEMVKEVLLSERKRSREKSRITQKMKSTGNGTEYTYST